MSTQPIIREAPVVETVEAANIGRPYRRLYLSVPTKFALALLLAIAWTALSVWLSQRWLNDLAAITTWAFALIAIGFIAYVPGFMNAFPHRFRLNLAPSGTYAPTPVDIPAVPAQITQELMRTRETWHWTDGPPPSPAIFKGMPVIE